MIVNKNNKKINFKKLTMVNKTKVVFYAKISKNYLLDYFI